MEVAFSDRAPRAVLRLILDRNIERSLSFAGIMQAEEKESRPRSVLRGRHNFRGLHTAAVKFDYRRTF